MNFARCPPVKLIYFRRSCWNLNELAGKPRVHPIHSHWRYGITAPSEVLENVIVNIEQCGETDYIGMLETYSIQEVMKARSQDLEDLLAKVMEMERETGNKCLSLVSILLFLRKAGIRVVCNGPDQFKIRQATVLSYCWSDARAV
jgi:hypothetical protein